MHQTWGWRKEVPLTSALRQFCLGLALGERHGFSLLCESTVAPKRGQTAIKASHEGLTRWRRMIMESMEELISTS